MVRWSVNSSALILSKGSGVSLAKIGSNWLEIGKKMLSLRLKYAEFGKKSKKKKTKPARKGGFRFTVEVLRT